MKLTSVFFIPHLSGSSSAFPWQPPRTVQPSERVYTIGDLAAASRYQLRVSAHNNIGATTVVYNFTTLTLEGGKIYFPVKKMVAIFNVQAMAVVN